MPARQVLRRGLPEGPPQAAQEDMQAACGRAQGRGVVRSGAGEAGGGLLPDLHSSNSSANKPASPMLKVGAGAQAKTQRDKARKTGPSDDGQYWPEVRHG
ncbi:hypothetical protein THAOC_23553, partial [Thalassiosira oceanica]